MRRRTGEGNHIGLLPYFLQRKNIPKFDADTFKNLLNFWPFAQ
jgi:hypothetical protein